MFTYTNFVTTHFPIPIASPSINVKSKSPKIDRLTFVTLYGSRTGIPNAGIPTGANFTAISWKKFFWHSQSYMLHRVSASAGFISVSGAFISTRVTGDRKKICCLALAMLASNGSEKFQTFTQSVFTHGGEGIPMRLG